MIFNTKEQGDENIKELETPNLRLKPYEEKYLADTYKNFFC